MPRKSPETVKIEDVLTRSEPGDYVETVGWIQSMRCYGRILFIDLVDYSETIQVVARKDMLGQEAFDHAIRIPAESSVKISGTVTVHPKRNETQIACTSIEVIGIASLNLSPRPRSKFDILAPRYASLLLNKRHLFLRNQKVTAIMRFRHVFLKALREWFQEQGCVEFTAPILTESLLYDDSTAFSVDFFGHKTFLTQCVAFYLEAALSAFGKVYNIGPSFRAEPSRGRRHIAEYWHVKAEIAFASRDDIMRFTENMVFYVARKVKEEASMELNVLGAAIDLDLMEPPYPRISYYEAVDKLNKKGQSMEFGKSLSDEDQRVLSLDYDTPFFVVGLPSSVEAFPYVVDSSDNQVTRTADLFAPEGYGELLGTAEKIVDPDELERRFKEKGKGPQLERYQWYFELRKYGCVPHAGFGMGVERVIRWMLKLPHVRDAIPFPRMYRRRPYP